MSEGFDSLNKNIPIYGISCRLVGDSTFLISSENWLDVLSSAAFDGGLRRARHIFNHTVTKSYNCEDPSRDLDRLAAEMDLHQGVIGLMTAVDVRRTVVVSESKKDLTVAAVCTAGTSNPCTAGRPVLWDNKAAAPGTINIVVLINGSLTQAAMVNAVITATEAKTRAIVQCGITMPDGSMATGTTTDAVAIACTGRGKPLPYAGAATDVGYLIGSTVYQAVEQGLKDYLAGAE
jgi:adenosylcobinamide hydrolase